MRLGDRPWRPRWRRFENDRAIRWYDRPAFTDWVAGQRVWAPFGLHWLLRFSRWYGYHRWVVERWMVSVGLLAHRPGEMLWHGGLRCPDFLTAADYANGWVVRR